MNEHLTNTLFISILTSSMLILAILLLRALFHRRIRMRLQYALWLPVAIRLLILPVPLFDSPLSVLRIAELLQTRPDSSARELDTWNDFLQSPDIGSTAEQAPYRQRLLPSAHPWAGRTAEKAKATIAQLLTAVAATGSVIVFLYFLIGNIRLSALLHRRRIRFRTDSLRLPAYLRADSLQPPAYPGTDNRKLPAHLGTDKRQLPACLKADGLRLPVYLVEGLPSPFLYGRAIYLTPAMTEDSRKLSHILTHEYCHYRQGDTLWAVVRCLCVTLYWWNPLVWLAASLSRQDCELSCDEASLRLLGNGERLSYGKTLIELVPIKKTGHNHCSIATTMSEGGRSMKNRIRQIVTNSRATSSLCVLLTMLALICFISMSTTASTLPKDSSVTATENTEHTENSGGTSTVLPEPTCSYIMQTDDNSSYFDVPSLYLNEEEQTFSFHISAASSYLIIGTYELENDRIIARTLDGKHEYQFQFEDTATLIYLDGPVSTAVGVPDTPLTPEIVPGSRFCLTDTPDSTDSDTPPQNADSTGTQDTPSTQDTPTTQDTAHTGTQTEAGTEASRQGGKSSQPVHDLDQAVGLAVLSYNRSQYTEEECQAEGHILLEWAEQENGKTTAYALTMYGEYQFQDNSFIKASGSGVIPAVITFSYDAHDGYTLDAYDMPTDGSYYIESVHELFPEPLWDICISPTESAVEELTKQEHAYAEHYLQQLGRDAAIGQYGDSPHTLLTDAGVSVEVSNLMCEYEKYDDLWKYPDWIGQLERVENGVRYVYALSLDNAANEIVYTKSIYDTDTVVEMHVFDSLTGIKKK